MNQTRHIPTRSNDMSPQTIHVVTNGMLCFVCWLILGFLYYFISNVLDYGHLWWSYPHEATPLHFSMELVVLTPFWCIFIAISFLTFYILKLIYICFFLFHWVEYDQAMGGCTLIHWWHSIAQLLLGNIMLAIKIFWMVSWITLHALSEANVVECVVHPTKPWMKGIILYS